MKPQKKKLNPFISIIPSKPLMSSRSWLTLHNCEIYYLSSVNYNPPDYRCNFHKGQYLPWGGGLLAHLFYQIHYLLLYNISRGHIYPVGGGGGEGAYSKFFSSQ
jgi:hypothetical protein